MKSTSLKHREQQCWTQPLFYYPETWLLSLNTKRWERDFDVEPEISFPGVHMLNIARSPGLCMKQSQSEMKPCTSNKQHKYLICSLMDPNMGFRGHVNDPTKWFVIVKLAIWGSAHGVKSTFAIKQPAASRRLHVHLKWEQKQHIENSHYGLQVR